MAEPYYDIAIIGLGPAGSTLARLLTPSFSVIALDKKRPGADEGFKKPCGGLLAPDAQRSLARFGLTLPLHVLATPQIFAVRTIDMSSGITRHYQRFYLNLDRHAFDAWLTSLIPSHVQVRQSAQCSSLARHKDVYRVSWLEGGATHTALARHVVGADGASSFVRRAICPGFTIRRYTAIQQWHRDGQGAPTYSCVFDPEITDCYAWGLPKNNAFIFGGAFAPYQARRAFEALKAKLSGRQGFKLDAPFRTEACSVLRPAHPAEIYCGEDNAFLLGEAAGFISPSSLEGLSYAFDSALRLSRVFNAGSKQPNRAYFFATLDLRAKLFAKMVKTPFIYNPPIRKAIMRSGFGSIRPAED